MKYRIEISRKFKLQLKKLSFADKNAVFEVVKRLADGIALERKFRDHALKGGFAGCRECHAKNDLLLVYKKQDDILVLTCVGVGSHSELF